MTVAYRRNLRTAVLLLYHNDNTLEIINIRTAVSFAGSSLTDLQLGANQHPKSSTL